MRKKTGLRDVEEFVIRDRKINQGGGGEENQKFKISRLNEERNLVVNIMRKTLRDNSKLCIKLRKTKVMAEKRLVQMLGGKTRKYWRIENKTKKYCEDLKERLKTKNKKIVEWLQKKYVVRQDEMYEEMTNEEREKFGMAKLFEENCDMKGDKLRKPEVINSGGVGADMQKVGNLGT